MKLPWYMKCKTIETKTMEKDGMIEFQYVITFHPIWVFWKKTKLLINYFFG